MEELETLNLKGNRIDELPQSVYKLKKLVRLNLAYNRALRSLDCALSVMPLLSELDVTGCRSIEHPPYSICAEGLPTMKQYFSDICNGPAVEKPIVTVVVVGASGAGKSSFIKTLGSQNRTRVLTDRSPTAENDESTRVFGFEKVDFDDVTLKFIDLGGQEVYHAAYKLILRENTVPVIVVNLVQYDTLAEKNGPREAVKKLFFDWMAHLCLSQPTLDVPYLILTHSDQFTVKKYQRLREGLLSATKEYHSQLVSEDESWDKNNFGRVNWLSNTTNEIFRDVYTVDNNPHQYHEYSEIKRSISHVCSNPKFAKTIPKAWQRVEAIISTMPGTYTSVADVFEEVSSVMPIQEHQLEIILGYIHDAGNLLWFKNAEPLKQHIFHKIDEVTVLLSVLHDHIGTEKWEERNVRFGRRKVGEDVMERYDYVESVKKFRDSGVIRELLLSYLIWTETSFNTDEKLAVALQILKSFQLIHGPMCNRSNGGPTYIVPYFAVGSVDVENLSGTQRDLYLPIEFHFKGLALPQYAYHQIITVLVEYFVGNSAVPVIKKDGASVVHNQSVIKCIYNSDAQKMFLHFGSRVENLPTTWNHLVEVTNAMIEYVQTTWPASRMECMLHCVHCLLKSDSDPRLTKNPSWCRLVKHADETNCVLQARGMIRMVCKEEADVPSALVTPCK